MWILDLLHCRIGFNFLFVAIPVRAFRPALTGMEKPGSLAAGAIVAPSREGFWHSSSTLQDRDRS